MSNLPNNVGANLGGPVSSPVGPSMLPPSGPIANPVSNPKPGGGIAGVSSAPILSTLPKQAPTPPPNSVVAPMSGSGGGAPYASK